jgi:small subunit ribosomal protein S23
MGRQIRPARVLQMASAELSSRIVSNHKPAEPAWYRVVSNIPPAQTIVRPAAAQLQKPDPKQRRPRNVYRPQRIVFPEDALRQNFYKDHPWELARPRIVLELDGLDSRMLDWSKGVRQPGMALSGEW